MPEQFESIWKTLRLDKTQDAGWDLAATIMPATTEDWRDTLRTSLPQLPIGDAENAHFRLSSVLGQGGMGIVHLAHQSALGRDVAIKMIHQGQSRRAENALLQEARVMGIVEHPNVVPVHVIGQDEQGRPVIVMKRVQGVVWSEYADGRVEPDAEDPLGFHLSVLIAVCQAMSFAHDRSILHRDIKPENVIIGSFGEVYLLDWGLAVSLDESVSRVPFVGEVSEVVGTPAYMAPEMTTGQGASLGVHTDVFLLGASLYHAITGAPPNRGDTLFGVMCFAYEGTKREYPEGTSPEMIRICERAMAHEGADRYTSANDLKEALEDYLLHRNSYELFQLAESRLRQLENNIESEVEEGVHQLFGEARFGFVSALQIWDENTEAKSELTRCLRLMLQYELDRENILGARIHLEELGEDGLDLSEAVDALELSLGKQAAALQKIAYDYDDSVGVVARRNGTLILMLLFVISPFLIRFGQSFDVPASLAWITTDSNLLASNLVGLIFFPYMAAGVRFTWVRYRSHKTSRVIVAAFLVMAILATIARSSTLWAGVPLSHSCAAEVTGFSVGSLVLGLAVDRRLWPVGVVYGLGTIPLLLFPDHAMDIYNLTGFLGAVVLLAFNQVVIKRSGSKIGGTCETWRNGE